MPMDNWDSGYGSEALIAAGSALLTPRQQGGGFAAVGPAILQAKKMHQDSMLQKLYRDAQIQQMGAMTEDRKAATEQRKLESAETQRRRRAQQMLMLQEAGVAPEVIQQYMSSQGEPQKLSNGGTITQMGVPAAAEQPQIEQRPYQLGPDNRAAIAAMPTEPGSRVPVMPNGSRVRTIQLGEDPMPGPDNRAAIAAMPTAPGSSVPIAPDGSRVRTIPGAMESPQAQQQAPKPKSYQLKLMQYLDAGFPPEIAKELANSDAGKAEVARTADEMGNDGQVYTWQLDKYGRKVGQPIIKPVESRVVSQGDRQTFVNPYTNQAMGSLNINQSADSKASTALGYANLGNAKANTQIARERLNFDREFPAMHISETGDGTMYVDPRGRINAKPVIGPDGKPLAGKPLTEGQATAAGYADRMQAAEKIMGTIGDKGNATAGTTIAGALPLIGAPAQRLAMSAPQQQVKQAQDDWIRSKLRKESGAVIGADEMEAERQTYFPQPGDSPQVIVQKAQARQIAISAMQRMSGGKPSPAAAPAPAPAGPTPSVEDLLRKYGN